MAIKARDGMTEAPPYLKEDTPVRIVVKLIAKGQNAGPPEKAGELLEAISR
jgi:hypothetical protein